MFLFLVGVPMMYLEMTVGQYFHVGNITLWGKVNVYMKGIGYGSLLVVCYITLYYSTIIAYSVFYLIASFHTDMPWSRCDNKWNTLNCRVRARVGKKGYTYDQLINLYNQSNQTALELTTPSEEYFNRFMLGINKSTGIDDLGGIKIDLALCLAAVYAMMLV